MAVRIDPGDYVAAVIVAGYRLSCHARLMSKLTNLIFAAIVLTPLQAFAWGTDGHRIVCAIAWAEMKPAVREKVEGLLDIRDKAAFADLCNWADEYRGRGGHQETAPWHYVDVPPGAKTVDMHRDCPEPRSCAVGQIERDAATLRSGAPVDERARALKFLIHFVGDLHQPLHVSHARDEGGSKIRGEFMGRATNMHSVWDFGIIRASGILWEEIADQLEHRVTATERKAWTASKPLDWANESLAIANAPETEYVVREGPFDLGEDYERRELPVVEKRLSQAGVRLGHLLNLVFAGVH